VLEQRKKGGGTNEGGVEDRVAGTRWGVSVRSCWNLNTPKRGRTAKKRTGKEKAESLRTQALRNALGIVGITSSFSSRRSEGGDQNIPSGGREGSIQLLPNKRRKTITTIT